jgi:hypothetical protein
MIETEGASVRHRSIVVGWVEGVELNFFGVVLKSDQTSE